jgi:uncharacterized protein (TIGR01777 family)
MYAGPGLTVAVTGASGLIGSALSERLSSAGHRVVPLVRRAPGPGEVQWDPAAGRIDSAALEGIDAAVHLAGESIGTGRWTRARKADIRESRVRGTSLLARALGGLVRRPQVLVSASAVGIYGDRGDEPLTEESPAGEGFLPETGIAWEAAALPARDAGIRVVHPRMAAVLSKHGGMLERLLLPFRLGLGGPIGGGAQWMPVVALDDVVGAIEHLIATPELAGPVNVSLPRPVTNREFARALGRAVRRPAVLPLPAFPLRAVYGQLADELLLASARVLPEALERSGYRFRHPTIDAALASALAGTPPTERTR